MLLPLHITIALLSLIYTGVVYFAPSRAKLKGSYALTFLTVASGTGLIIANPSHMVQSCITGLAYLGAMFFGIAMARQKLAKESQKI